MALFGGPKPKRDSVIGNMETQINSVCQKHNPNYKALFVSWNDNQRQQGSCWGGNITDARLKGRDGEDFLVVRSQNFNERIGRVRAADVALLVGEGTSLEPITLEQYLADFWKHGSYAGSIPGNTSLLSGRDKSVGMRFQAVFLPVDKGQLFGKGVKEFYPDTYNYQTRSWEEPKNLILLCTSQGTFVQQDGPGSVPQFLHQRDALGQWRKKYLEAMMTHHGVSMGQTETEAEREAALKQGKAVSTVIGTRAMGTGFNRLMTIQVPMKQQTVRPRISSPFIGLTGGIPCGTTSNTEKPTGSFFPCGGGFPKAVPMCAFGAAQPQAAAAMPMAAAGFGAPGGAAVGSAACDLFDGLGTAKAAATGLFGGYGHERTSAAHAARVSIGSDAGAMDTLRMTSFERDSECSVTITVQFYFVVEQGCAIAEADIKRAIDVCEEAYKGCSWDGNLMDVSMSSAFAKKDMSWEDALKISPPMDSTLIFPGSAPGPVSSVTTWPSPPRVPFPSASFDPLAGLEPELKMQVAKVPLQQEGYDFLHSTALKLLDKCTQLDTAFHLFRLSSDLHVQLHGTPDPTSLYNMACCLAVAVRVQIERYQSHFPGTLSLGGCTVSPGSAGGVVGPKMPPASPACPTTAALCEARLDAAIKLLAAAIGAGWRQHSHMETDPDLAALAELRKSRFEALLQLAKSISV
mmetsp:Transcript_85727/g.136110  ORF Transcript_85727/g.136110 Transcript_85727/m.136110 type:complete len:688 (+) Transcript_85727:80-2143(+)